VKIKASNLIPNHIKKEEEKDKKIKVKYIINIFWASEKNFIL